MEGNTMGGVAMVEPGNAPAPLGRDRVEPYTYMVICSGAGVPVTLVGSGMVFAIGDRYRRLDGELDRGLGRIGLYSYMVIYSGAGVLVTLVGSGMIFAIDDRCRRLDGEVDRGLGRRQCPTPPSTPAEANANRPNGEDLLRRLERLGVGDRLMPAKEPSVSGAYLNVMYGYDDAASEDAFEEHLYHRASVHRADRLQILYFRPIAHQMPPPCLLNGCRSARPHSGRAWAAEIPGDGGELRLLSRKLE
jgi:hypothetical protein